MGSSVGSSAILAIMPPWRLQPEGGSRSGAIKVVWHVKTHTINFYSLLVYIEAEILLQKSFTVAQCASYMVLVSYNYISINQTRESVSKQVSSEHLQSDCSYIFKLV